MQGERGVMASNGARYPFNSVGVGIVPSMAPP